MKACWTFIVALLCAADAEACSCRDLPLQVYFHHSLAVFSGRVMRVQESREKGYNGMLATVYVLESWKGARPGQVVMVATGHGGGDCGVGFVAGTQYLVFADLIPRKGWLTTTTCKNTKRLVATDADADSLRSWAITGRVPDDPPRHGSKQKPLP